MKLELCTQFRVKSFTAGLFITQNWSQGSTWTTVLGTKVTLCLWDCAYCCPGLSTLACWSVLCETDVWGFPKRETSPWPLIRQQKIPMALFCNGVKEKQGEDIFDKCHANLLLQNLELSSFLSSSVSGWSGDKRCLLRLEMPISAFSRLMTGTCAETLNSILHSPAALYSESWVTSNVTLGCKMSTPEQNRKPIYVKLKAIFLVHHLLPSSKWNTFCQNYRLPLHPALGHRIYLCTTKGNKHYRKIMTFKAAGTLPNTSYMCVHRWKWTSVYPQGPIRKMQSPLQ